MTDADRRARQHVRMLLDLERYDEAEQAAGSLAASEPDGEILTLLAAARVHGRDRLGALEAAQAAIAADPDAEWPYRIASVACSRLGRRDSAVGYARAAVAADPQQAMTHVQLAFALVGRRRLLLPRRDPRLVQAQTEAQIALRLNPDLILARKALAEVALARGRRRQARAIYEQSLGLEPGSHDLVNDVARVDLAGNRLSPARLARAASGFSTALGLRPSDRTVGANLTLALNLFLQRSLFGMFLCAYLGFRIADVPGEHSRWLFALPAFLLLLPAAYAARFLHVLDPSLRGPLWQTARRPLCLGALATAGVSSALLVLAAVAQAYSRPAFVTACVLAIAGVVLARIAARREQPS